MGEGNTRRPSNKRSERKKLAKLAKRAKRGERPHEPSATTQRHPGKTRRARQQPHVAPKRGAWLPAADEPSALAEFQEHALVDVVVSGQNLATVTLRDLSGELVHIEVNSTVLDQKDDEEVWLTVREQLQVTASEFSAVLDESRFSSREQLMKVKLGLTPRFRGNEATAWGLRMEPNAVREYCEFTGHTVRSAGLFMSPDCRWGASPDGLVIDDAENSVGLLEVKTLFGRRGGRMMPRLDVCPRRFWPQIQGQLALTDREWCDLMVWIPPNPKAKHGRNFHVLRVRRDRDYWTRFLEPELVKFADELKQRRAALAPVRDSH